ncbi:nad-dependent epimerase dehydratase [Leptolyngbya sp. Heron Island J]|uniref:SDR family oxidoreductase n=1 Tax=Leptolyngbya sp. Heron Island J TaxID=1385935 RepID=UPI0003B9626F|nr:SDR family oxidoreductase [Leptolyngbya sp. Heron Island J]ESA34735.1 nad-dependent epimerase dehydratase [Leptolyngbya sp. Heron Island J]
MVFNFNRLSGGSLPPTVCLSAWLVLGLTEDETFIAIAVSNIQQLLITGATGGVGQLAVAYALKQGYQVRASTRNIAKARPLFDDRVELKQIDLRQPDTLTPSLDGIDAVLCCSGTTAFPSDKWQVDLPSQPFEQLLTWSRIFLDADYRQRHTKNSPAIADDQGVKNLIAAAKNSSVSRFVMVSSLGIDRKDQFPFNLLNAYGVLDAKQAAEQALRDSELTYTIVRPGRLIDGPYTSYDLNTLLKASTDGKQGIVLGRGDQLLGQTSRKDVAAACVECLQNATTEKTTFEIINQGERPVNIAWPKLFTEMAQAG